MWCAEEVTERVVGQVHTGRTVEVSKASGLDGKVCLSGACKVESHLTHTHTHTQPTQTASGKHSRLTTSEQASKLAGVADLHVLSNGLQRCTYTQHAQRHVNSTWTCTLVRVKSSD